MFSFGCAGGEELWTDTCMHACIHGASVFFPLRSRAMFDWITYRKLKPVNQADVHAWSILRVHCIRYICTHLKRVMQVLNGAATRTNSSILRIASTCDAHSVQCGEVHGNEHAYSCLCHASLKAVHGDTISTASRSHAALLRDIRLNNRAWHAYYPADSGCWVSQIVTKHGHCVLEEATQHLGKRQMN